MSWPFFSTRSRGARRERIGPRFALAVLVHRRFSHFAPVLAASALAVAASFAACVPADPVHQRVGFTPHDDGGGAGSAAPASIDPPSIPADSFVALKDAKGAHDDLCANDGAHPKFPDDADLVTKTFCQDIKPGGVMPTPKSFAELLALFGLDFKNATGANGAGGNPAFAMLGHSSALTARKVSALTPTAFIFTPPPADGSKPPGYIAVAFDPGEQFVEIASHDPTADKVNFYLMFFDHDCTSAPGGCPESTLLGPALLTGWSNVRIYEDTTTLGNTVFDCRVCHQPNNDGAPMLRMQENTPPFTHWFSDVTKGGVALYADFRAAHDAKDDYGGIPAALVEKADPSKLAALVKQAGFGNQPNAFASAAIEDDVAASSRAQPAVNLPVGASGTWQTLYEGAVSGRFIATPYHDVKITDPQKLATMTGAYRDFIAGKRGDLPDIRDVFLDSAMRDMGVAPKAGLDGRGLLVQVCQECHHSKLDMTISREAFLVDKLDAMTRKERDVAIERLRLGMDTRLRMPPQLFRTITDEERAAMIDELKK